MNVNVNANVNVNVIVFCVSGGGACEPSAVGDAAERAVVHRLQLRVHGLVYCPAVHHRRAHRAGALALMEALM